MCSFIKLLQHIISSYRFANKQDKEGALDVPAIKKKLKLQTLSEKYEFKYNVVCYNNLLITC